MIIGRSGVRSRNIWNQLAKRREANSEPLPDLHDDQYWQKRRELEAMKNQPRKAA